MREWMMSMTATVPMFSAMTTLLTVGDMLSAIFFNKPHEQSISNGRTGPILEFYRGRQLKDVERGNHSRKHASRTER